MRITYLVKRWEHHTSSGGYDRLVKNVDSHVIRRSTAKGFASRAAGLAWRAASKPRHYLLDYRLEDWLAEWRTLVSTRLRRTNILHLLYGDEQLDVLLRHRNLLPCSLVATFHLPTSRVKMRFEHHQKSLIGGIDLAIVVSTSQLADYRRWLGPDRVVYVPHGIDTDRFQPGNRTEPRDIVRLLVVGAHMRDWETIHSVIDQCTLRNLPVEVDVVNQKDCFAFFTGCKNVRLHERVSEEELLSLYRNADALLLPVSDATAINAVLESLACGTPVISTSVGGVPDYVDASAGWLFDKGDAMAIVNLIEEISGDREVALSKRQGAREKSLQFDWGKVQTQIREAYKSLNVKPR